MSGYLEFRLSFNSSFLLLVLSTSTELNSNLSSSIVLGNGCGRLFSVKAVVVLLPFINLL